MDKMLLSIKKIMGKKRNHIIEAYGLREGAGTCVIQHDDSSCVMCCPEKFTIERTEEIVKEMFPGKMWFVKETRPCGAVNYMTHFHMEC